jgi:hypothetical protein
MFVSTQGRDGSARNVRFLDSTEKGDSLSTDRTFIEAVGAFPTAAPGT